MSDLAALFPDLPPEILRDFDAAATSFQSNAPLSIGGEQAQVTDDQIADYLRSVGSLRAPLNPAVSGQQAPPSPQFTAGQGRLAPNPQMAYVEAPDLGDAASSPPEAAPPSEPPPTTPSSPPRSQSPTATDTTPLPSSPPPPPPPPYTAPDESIPPPPPAATRQAGMEALVQLWDGDPELRNLVAGYLTTGRAPATQPPSIQPPPPPPTLGGAPSQQQYYPPPPPQQPYAAPQPQYGLQQPPQQPYLPQDDFTDPNLRALYEQNAQLQARLSQLESAQQYSADQYNRSQMNHYEQIVESTVSKFGTDYQLPPNVLQSVRETASRIGAANTYMNGTHPITGLPVRPDPHEAVKAAMSIAYYATPAAQELERTRTIQRAQHDAQRHQRLSGVGGSSASVPRQPPQPTNVQDRRSAMNEEVREMFNGTWTGGNNN